MLTCLFVAKYSHDKLGTKVKLIVFIASFISISFQDGSVLVVNRFIDFNKFVSTIKCMSLTDKDNRISKIVFPLIGYA